VSFVAVTHDRGKVVISVVKDGSCNIISGYRITEKGSELSEQNRKNQKALMKILLMQKMINL
jgi:hypothetical protein